ncbi:MAG: hypothetical protein KDD67_00935 [Ignavibacteriae bacterium]|nr:hypothetical protein [Ignavibacteriota bacterium]MCB9216609.1 hypothetical protein [Ignavibacteria bacterium]
MMYHTLRLIALFAFVLPSILLVACGGDLEPSKKNTPAIPASEAGEPVTGDWVVIHNLSDPQSLNYLTSTDASASEINGYIVETLTLTDWRTLETIPWIAEELPVVGADLMSYDFRIRKGITFSDGEPLTGENFIFYLKTMKNPFIVNAAPQRTYYARVDSAELIDGDPYHLRVVMAEPYYLGDQWAGGLVAFPKHVWDPEGKTDAISFKELNGTDSITNPYVKEFAEFFQDPQKAFDPKFLIGTGPYIFEQYRQNDRVVLKRNDNYWYSSNEWGKAWPDKVVWLTINDQNASLSALKSGDIDFVPRLAPIQYKYEKSRFERNDLIPCEYDYPAYSYIGYNEEKPIFSDKLVRKALAYAIDRKTIIDNVYFGYATPVQSPIYLKRPEYDTTIKIIDFDLEKSKEILDQAGWKDSDGNGIRDKVIDGKKTDLTFKILLNSGNAQRKQMALIFIDALRKIGVTATTDELDWSVFLDRTRDGEYDAYIGGWAMGVTEGDMYQLWHSESSKNGGSNYVRFRNPELDRIIETIRGTFDFDQRKVLYKEAQRIIDDEQPYNFLVASLFLGGVHKRFQNVEFFAPRPCYSAAWWWVPKGEQKYTTSTNQVVALN